MCINKYYEKFGMRSTWSNQRGIFTAGLTGLCNMLSPPIRCEWRPFDTLQPVPLKNLQSHLMKRDLLQGYDGAVCPDHIMRFDIVTIRSPSDMKFTDNMPIMLFIFLNKKKTWQDLWYIQLISWACEAWLILCQKCIPKRTETEENLNRIQYIQMNSGCWCFRFYDMVTTWSFLLQKMKFSD